MARVLIQKFEREGNQGSLLELGVADLKVESVELGTRLTDSGIGCASSWITRAEEFVSCVHIGGRWYKVKFPTFASGQAKADYAVNLPYDHDVKWTSERITLLKEVS